MELALKEMMQEEGIARNDVEVSLNHISRQLALLDEKLKNRIDNEIWKLFQLEQQEINKVEMRIASLLEYK